jgi:signal transduction histidine kinase
VPLSSLRVRLIVMVVAVVGTAMGVVFLYVVPSLRENLVNDRIHRLEHVAVRASADPRVRRTLTRGEFSGAVPYLQRAARAARARLNLFEMDRRLPVSINVPVGGTVQPDDPIVLTVAETRAAATSHSTTTIRVAIPVPHGVLVLTQPAGDVDATARLVERRILIATVLAVAVASVVGWASSLGLTRRVRRLELAARRISRGQFDAPIGDRSPDELGRLARSFDLMQDRLAQIDRSRKDFIANASHELRTPLFSLGGFLELLDDEDLDPETRDEFLKTMREQVTRLGKLATDLLDLSRLDAGAVAIRNDHVDLRVTARSLVREFRGLAAQRGSRVLLGAAERGLPATYGDEQRVNQIGRALVDNAIRHTPPGTDVTVSARAEDAWVVLEVADNGPGIDPEVRDSIFERFSRGPTASGGGSGLGLAIAFELAQRMGGTLEVDTTERRTRFRLALPAVPTRSREPAPA